MQLLKNPFLNYIFYQKVFAKWNFPKETNFLQYLSNLQFWNIAYHISLIILCHILSLYNLIKSIINICKYLYELTLIGWKMNSAQPQKENILQRKPLTFLIIDEILFFILNNSSLISRWADRFVIAYTVIMTSLITTMNSVMWFPRIGLHIGHRSFGLRKYQSIVRWHMHCKVFPFSHKSTHSLSLESASNINKPCISSTKSTYISCYDINVCNEIQWI